MIIAAVDLTAESTLSPSLILTSLRIQQNMIVEWNAHFTRLQTYAVSSGLESTKEMLFGTESSTFGESIIAEYFILSQNNSYSNWFSVTTCIITKVVAEIF